MYRHWSGVGVVRTPCTHIHVEFAGAVAGEDLLRGADGDVER